jgi:branched-chain amino acid transport system substrate-binding protein
MIGRTVQHRGKTMTSWSYVTLATAALAVAMTGEPAGAQQKPPIKLGAVLPMTGILGSTGLMFRTGIEIAVDEINANGGVNGSQIQLIVEDDKFSPQESVLMYRKHAGQGSVAVLGPISSSSWENVSPIAPRVGVPAISFTFTYKEGVPNNDWTLGVSPDERTMLPEAVDEFVQLHPNVKKVVIAADVQQATGAGAIPLYRAAAKKHNIDVLEVIEFQSTMTDFSPIVTRIRGANPDAVWSAAVPPSAVAMLREMQSQKYDPIILNDSMIWPGGFPSLAGSAAGKVYTFGFSTNEKLAGNEKHNRYIDQFQARLRNNPQMPQPPNPGNSVTGHEAVYLVADILKRKGIDGTWDAARARATIKDALAETKEFHNIFDIKIDRERNGYIRAHLLKDDPVAKEWKYALPEGQR